MGSGHASVAAEGGSALSDAARTVLALATTWPELDGAVALLVHRCMTRNGFDPPWPEPQPDHVMPPNLAGIVGLLDERARHEGYPRRDRTAPPDPMGGYIESLDPRARHRAEVALLGEPDGPAARVDLGDAVVTAALSGCAAEARREVYGSVEGYLRLAYLPMEVTSTALAALQSPTVASGFERYAVLMREAGYDAGSFKAVQRLASARFGGRAATEPASEDELRMASVDLDCQLKVALRDTANKAVLTLAEPYLRTHADDIGELGRLLDSSRERARQVLGASG